MLSQSILTLNAFQTNATEQLQQLVILYKNQRISLADLTSTSIGLNIAPDMLNLFAVKLHAGSDGLVQNQEGAVGLFIYAGEKGSSWGNANAGCKLIYGIGNIKSDIPKAILLLTQAASAFKSKKENSAFADYWLGVAYRRNGDYKKATASFKQVKDNDDLLKKAQQAIKDMHSNSLTEIYAGADRHAQIPVYKELKSFSTAIKKYYTDLAAEYPTLAQPMSPDDGLDYKEMIKQYYTELNVIYNALIARFPARKRYYDKNLNQLKQQVEKAISNVENISSILDVEMKISSSENSVKDQKETKSADEGGFVSGAAVPASLAEQISLSYIVAPQLEDKSAEQAPKWLPVSRVLDGYDSSNAIHLFTAEMEVAKIQEESIWQVTSVISKHMEEAKKAGASTDILKEKLTHVEKTRTAVQNTYKAAQKSHEELVNGAELKEFQRQITTERRFFSPCRTGSLLTREIAVKLQANRCVVNSADVKALNVSGVPARRMITAERSTNEASLRLFGHSESWYGTELGWQVMRKEKRGGYYSSYESCYGNLEEIILGGTAIRYEHRTDPHHNHRGDYYMRELGAYTQIVAVLNRITGSVEAIQSEKEKALAKLMLRYCRTGKAISADDLESNDIQTDVGAEDIQSLNRILYHCFVKEIARWQLPKEAATHELPWATAQIRAVKLIAMGFLTMREVFDQDAPYGVFTGTNIGENIDKVKEKMKTITRLYIEVCLKQNKEGLDEHIKFFKKYKQGELVTTRAQLRADLAEYGASSDTDKEGYDSETAKQDTVQCGR